MAKIDKGGHNSMRAIVCSLLLTFLLSPAVKGIQQKTYRVALIIGNNTTQSAERKPLRFADDDAVKYYRLFSSITESSYLLSALDLDTQRLNPDLVPLAQEPSLSNLQLVLEEIKRKYDSVKNKRNFEFYFVFCGHGGVDDQGQGYIELLRSTFTRTDLTEKIIKPFDGARLHIILDSCKSYFMAFSRSSDEKTDLDQRNMYAQIENFLDHEVRSLYPNVGLLISTSGGHDAHEWEKIQGGVFSHEVISALLGGADINSDGRVQYSEIAGFVEAANSSLAGAGIDLRVTVRPPAAAANATLINLGQVPGGKLLHFPTSLGGHYLLEDRRGIRLCEFHKSNQVATNILLLGPGPFYLTHQDRTAKITPGSRLWIHASQLDFGALPHAVRGPLEEAFGKNLFATPFDWSFYRGFAASTQWPQVTTQPKVVLRPPRLTQKTMISWQLAYQLMNPPYELKGLAHGIVAGCRLKLNSRFSALVGLGYATNSGDQAGESYQLHQLELRLGIQGAYSDWPVSLALELIGGLGTLWKFGDLGDGQDELIPFAEISLRITSPYFWDSLAVFAATGARIQHSQAQDITYDSWHWTTRVGVQW
jgi:hypothetical protein